MLVTHITAPERETIITMNDEDDIVHVWTAQRTVITALCKREAFTEVRSGMHGTQSVGRVHRPHQPVEPGDGCEAVPQPHG